ncbi:hypothetical protein VNO80_19028 [Phaseolus coccineus]|uniref:Uncharacterized protein n=1 Tax=Phaseolus coccineus TaxID=3886 RepID=A0AAN9MK51_PHACN
MERIFCEGKTARKEKASGGEDTCRNSYAYLSFHLVRKGCATFLKPFLSLNSRSEITQMEQSKEVSSVLSLNACVLP